MALLLPTPSTDAHTVKFLHDVGEIEQTPRIAAQMVGERIPHVFAEIIFTLRLIAEAAQDGHLHGGGAGLPGEV
jgi:hypothetical protein